MVHTRSGLLTTERTTTLDSALRKPGAIRKTVHFRPTTQTRTHRRDIGSSGISAQGYSLGLDWEIEENELILPLEDNKTSRGTLKPYTAAQRVNKLIEERGLEFFTSPQIQRRNKQLINYCLKRTQDLGCKCEKTGCKDNRCSCTKHGLLCASDTCSCQNCVNHLPKQVKDEETAPCGLYTKIYTFLFG